VSPSLAGLFAAPSAAPDEELSSIGSSASLDDAQAALPAGATTRERGPHHRSRTPGRSILRGGGGGGTSTKAAAVAATAAAAASLPVRAVAFASPQAAQFEPDAAPASALGLQPMDARDVRQRYGLGVREQAQEAEQAQGTVVCVIVFHIDRE
jgi:hypothetical protein